MSTLARIRALAAASIAAAALGAAGCGGAGEASDASEDSVDLTCGSTIGDAVAEAARSGPSTITGELESRRNRVTGGPYVGGAAITEALVDLVAHAKREVLIEFFSLDEDSWMAKRLAEAVASLPSSVRVYVLVHPSKIKHGWFGIPLAESEDDAATRLAHLFGDRPNVTTGAWERRGVPLDPTNLTGIFYGVMHDKMVVVDGARALVTDANLQLHADPVDEGGDGWCQIAMLVEGEIGAALRREAVETWSHAKQRGSVRLPAAPPVQPARACTRMIALGREAHALEDASANRGYVALFLAATRAVRALTPNLNDDGARAALAAATAKADVYLLLSKGFNDLTESLPGQGGNNDYNVRVLSELAADPCRLHVRWYADAGKPGVAVEGNGHYANHAKWASADGTTMILGSQNLDTESWKSSRELNVAIDDPKTTRDYDRMFQTMWNRAVVAYECKPGGGGAGGSF